MRFYWLILGILAVWRITHLLYAEDGPFDLFVGIRRLAGKSFVGKLLDCFYCLSLWISAPAAWLLGQSLLEQGLLWPALSGGASLLERLTRSPEPAPTYWEEEEADGVLREAETTDADGNVEPGAPPSNRVGSG